MECVHLILLVVCFISLGKIFNMIIALDFLIFFSFHVELNFQLMVIGFVTIL